MNPVNNASSFYTPLDTLIDCMMLKHGHPNASKLLCNISTFLGTYMAYVFPFIGTIDLISNCIVTTIFLRYLNHQSRQFIYLGVLAISDISIDIMMGWLRWFPTFGLPYASLGKVYYFISLTSSINCKLYMFCQSIACTFRGNIFMLMAMDRLLLIHKPLVYKRHSKCVIFLTIISVLTITIIMSLPVIIFCDLMLVFNLKICWYTNYTEVLIVYQVLFSNTCLVQLSLVTLIDSMFLVKLLKWSRRRRQVTDTNTSEMKNISPTVTMLLIHILTFSCALPCGIAYLLSATSRITQHEIPKEILHYSLLFINIGWTLIFLQSSMNIILYCIRIDEFRQILLKPLFDRQNKSSGNSKTTTLFPNR
ncbi:rhodopsin-like orphan GPCR [Schistosoma japonicum]|uniref:Rhodopsin-like orphan GPCR n=1 Tax=Schistosoma japonicum TaxID=6182 RepID=A0A4Z2D058_SCHJA|nr:rhodopsin-like orphan GPCR [Schistosoma japonicum]